MQGTDSDLQSNVNKWILEAFNQKFKTINAIITGSSEKGDNYIGDIAFVKVRAITPNDETMELNLVVKHGKESRFLREKYPIRKSFLREIFVYSELVPLLNQFARKTNVYILDDFMAKCFGTLVYENQEVILLQNLKSMDYSVHDRRKSLDINHLKLTLSNYGKLHAVSLAYQDQYPEKFINIFENHKEDIMDAFKNIIDDSMGEAQNGVYSILEANHEFGLLQEMKSEFESGFYCCFQEVKLKRESSNPLVFLHGDPWSNNCMFKYDDMDTSKPISAIILDFQLTKLGSPVFDLSHHIYSTASDPELQQLGTLLKTYHTNFSNTLRNLGSNPDHLFTYTQLVDDWKQYCSYGMFFAFIVLPLALSVKEDAVDIGEIDTNTFKMLYKKMGTNRLFADRIISIVKNYVTYNKF